MYQCLNGGILSRKCSIMAPARWRNSVYFLTQIFHQRSKWLGPISSKGFFKKDKTCAAIFQPNNNGLGLCIAVAQKNFITKLENNMMWTGLNTNGCCESGPSVGFQNWRRHNFFFLNSHFFFKCPQLRKCVCSPSLTRALFWIVLNFVGTSSDVYLISMFVK